MPNFSQPKYPAVGTITDETARQKFGADQIDHYGPDEPFVYGRYMDPIVLRQELGLAGLEKAAWALGFPAGMTAIDTALSVTGYLGRRENPARPVIYAVMSDVYGGTNGYLAHILRGYRGGVVHRFGARRKPAQILVPANGSTESAKAEYTRNLDQYERYEIADFKRFIEDSERFPEGAHVVFFFETISNPMLVVPPMDLMVKAVRKRWQGPNRPHIIVDNTFSTSVLSTMLAPKSGTALDIDLIVSSATKYLSGSGEIMAGVLFGNDEELYQEAATYRMYGGYIQDPRNAEALESRLPTFVDRFSRQCRNARTLAERLNGSPAIEAVRYPGMPSHPTYREALRQFGESVRAAGIEGCFGAMVTFDLGSDERANAFIKAVGPEIPYKPSLGDDRSSLLRIPSVFQAAFGAVRHVGGDGTGSETTHLERLFGGFIRFSVGAEDFDRLWETVEEGLQMSMRR